MKTCVLLVGCGNMGYAMLKGWLTAREGLEVWVVEPNASLRQRAADVGATAVASVADVPETFTPDLIVLAVKPQVMDKVLPDYRRWVDGSATFVSIAAGITLDFIAQTLSAKTPAIRCMPNTPAAIGAGAIVYCSNPHVTSTAQNLAKSLLSCSGEVARIEDEALMDAVTAVSGSGPAYLFHFIEALTQAAEKIGLPPELAAKLAMQTVYGSAQLAVQSTDSPGTLRQQVTSPGGTTEAALNVLMANNHFTNLVTEAVASAADRSRELSAD